MSKTKISWATWLGVSCENQQTADERIPLLLIHGKEIKEWPES